MRNLPSWARDVAALRAAGAEVRAYCARCDRGWVEDLAAVARFRGAAWSYAGRRAPCPHIGCGGTVFYRASIPGAGVWPLHLSELRPHG